MRKGSAGCRGGCRESGGAADDGGDEPAAKRANVAEDGEPKDAAPRGGRRRGQGREGVAPPEKEGEAPPDADADEDRPASEPPSLAAPPDVSTSTAWARWMTTSAAARRA